VLPLSFTDSLRERRDLVARHPERQRIHPRLKPWLSAVGIKKGIKKSFYRVKVLEQVISRVLFPVLVTLYGTMVIHLFPTLLLG